MGESGPRRQERWGVKRDVEETSLRTRGTDRSVGTSLFNGLQLCCHLTRGERAKTSRVQHPVATVCSFYVAIPPHTFVIPQYTVITHALKSLAAVDATVGLLQRISVPHLERSASRSSAYVNSLTSHDTVSWGRITAQESLMARRSFHSLDVTWPTWSEHGNS